jgi:hypothetical protein
MNNCKICKKQINNKRIYCCNKCKFSDDEYNLARSKKSISNDFSKKLCCPRCDWTTKDINNLSGRVTNHIKSHSDVNLKFIDFRIIDDLEFIQESAKEKLKCCICNWSTKDIKNKSGVFTNHIKTVHNLSLGEFIELHGEKYPDLWKIGKNNIERRTLINSDPYNRIVCNICNEPLKILSNSHLKKHNITQSEYKDIYGSIISANTSALFKKNLSNIEFPPQSKYELEILNYIKTIYNGDIITNTKKIIYPFEVDIYIPEKKLGIEFNGLYFHSELGNGKNRNYHLSKTITSEKNNIKLIQIFEDEWRNKVEIVKSIISSKLNVLPIKINARDCVIKSVSSNLKNDFLASNHIQGSDKSSVSYGLYHQNKLISIMTFGSLRAALGNSTKQNQYELFRFCSKIYVNCRGAFSKLFNHFINNHHPDSIITYADRRFSNVKNNVYNTNNLNFIGETKPNYFYTKNYDKRLHRFNFPKHKLVKMGHDSSLTEWEIMQSLEYDRIWDCGHLKFKWQHVPNSTEKS